jgi:MFS family permease
MSSAMAAAADYAKPEHRGKLMGMIGTLIGISISVSMLVGFLSYEVHHYLTFLLQGCAYLSASLTALILLKPGPPPRRVRKGGHGPHAGSSPSFLQAKLLLSYMVAFLLGGGMTFVTSLILPWGELTMGMSRKSLSALAGSTSLAFTVFVVVAGLLAVRVGRLRMITLGLCGYCGALFTVAVSSSVSVVSLTFIGTSVFHAMMYPVALDFAASLVPPHRRGLSMGVFHGTRSGGEIVFLLACPFLYENVGGKTAGFLFPVAITLGLAVFAFTLWAREGPDGVFPGHPGANGPPGGGQTEPS